MIAFEKNLMPSEAAARLLMWLEKQGGIARLESPEDYVRVDLDPIPGMTHAKAEDLSIMILGLRDELRQILRARRVTH